MYDISMTYYILIYKLLHSIISIQVENQIVVGFSKAASKV